LKRIQSLFLASLLAVLTQAASEATADTRRPAGWRNDGTGIWTGVTPPTKWSEKEGILWKTRVGGPSYSSLIKSGDRLFVVVEKAKILCLNADTGRILWRHKLRKKLLPENQRENAIDGRFESGNTAHTPLTDGRLVYVCLANSMIAAFDFDGKNQWTIALNQGTSGDGRSSSPVLVDGKLMWICGHLHAIDCATGELCWENGDVGESYGTPITITMDDLEVLVTPGGQAVRIADGKLLAADMAKL